VPYLSSIGRSPRIPDQSGRCAAGSATYVWREWRETREGLVRRMLSVKASPVSVPDIHRACFQAEILVGLPVRKFEFDEKESFHDISTTH
jgi:hypothetical protein